MLETGQPLHAYDASKLQGTIVVRRAKPGEKLTTLDDVERTLDPDDLVVSDDSGPIGLAGVMGGASTEVPDNSSDILLEAATWEPASIARTARRHKLPSEAARRFERYVDPAVAPAARGTGRPGCSTRLRRWPHRARPHRCRSSGAARPGDHGDQPAGQGRGRELPARRDNASAPADRLPGRGDHRRGRHPPGDRRAAELARRPQPARRPGRGGAAAGGLPEHPVRAALRARRSWPDRDPAPSSAPWAGRWPRPVTSRSSRSRSSPPTSGTSSASPTTTLGAAR